MNQIKPLNWTPKPGIGFTVVRRDDGGMTLTFTDLSDATLREWRDFAMEHLLSPSARSIRVAVVVADEKVANAIRNVAALTLPETASALKLFTDINEAEAWLARPLDQIP